VAAGVTTLIHTDDAEESAMTDTDNHAAGSQLTPRTVLIGATLIGAGALLARADMAIRRSQLMVSATRKRISEMEVPPGEIAKRQWTKARTAAAAGAHAWKDGQPAQQLQSRDHSTGLEEG
jgi:hypothetical protein